MFHRVVDEWDRDVRAGDPLGYPGYLAEVAALDHGEEAVRTGRTERYAFIEGRFDVFGGSMGTAAGERVVRAYDRAIDARLPVVLITRTGGARLQEGMVALIQLARTADAARRHRDAGLLSLAVHQHPSAGGVLVSYAALADVRVSHPGATIGFAGPRVAEAMLGEPLPEGSHTAEALHAAGLLDGLVSPGEEPAWVASALGFGDQSLPTRPLPAWTDPGGDDAWGEVLRARGAGRPSGIDRAARLAASWTELRGADPVVRAGLATVAGRRVVVVATDRHAGSGRPTAAGYRLALRAFALAERLRLPVLTLVDTPGADPSMDAELDGLVVDLSACFGAMAALTVPTVSVCVGEGGSGGALALAYADRLLIQEHAVFTVIAPEGAAAILERDPTQAARMADRLGLTSSRLLELGIVDDVVPEGQEQLEGAVTKALDEAVVGERRVRFDAASARWLL